MYLFDDKYMRLVSGKTPAGLTYEERTQCVNVLGPNTVWANAQAGQKMFRLTRRSKL